MSYNASLTIRWNGDKSALETGLGIMDSFCNYSVTIDNG